MSVIRKSSVFVAAFLGLFVSSARAQGNIIANVPFPFVVNHKEFPAGKYDLRAVLDGETVLSIEGMNNRSGALVLTMEAGGEDPIGDQPALVFTRHEQRYELSQIWKSRTLGRELPVSSAAHKTARSETQPEPLHVQPYVLAASLK